MKETNLFVFSEPEEVAEFLAKLIIEKIEQNKKQSKPFNLAISGGNTPNILFSMLAGEFAEKVDWSHLKLFWVDERCVDPNDTESNFGNVFRILLKNVPMPQENIFNMKGANEPAVEVIRYQKILKNELPEKNGLPVFDLVLLGMGDDGHTASIFPDNMELIHSTQIVASAVHPQTGQHRITLTGDVICNAEHVIFVITGHSKANVLEEIIQEKGDFERYPAYYILANCDAELYLDSEAAEML